MHYMMEYETIQLLVSFNTALQNSKFPEKKSLHNSIPIFWDVTSQLFIGSWKCL